MNLDDEMVSEERSIGFRVTKPLLEMLPTPRKVLYSKEEVNLVQRSVCLGSGYIGRVKLPAGSYSYWKFPRLQESLVKLMNLDDEMVSNRALRKGPLYPPGALPA